MERLQAALLKSKNERESGVFATFGLPRATPAAHDDLWASFPQATVDARLLARNKIVTANRSDAAYVQFDMLRTALLQSLRHNNWMSVAITSPTAGCGKSSIATNLALSLSHQREIRTVLIDLDLRRPQISRLLGINSPNNFARYLREEVAIEQAFIRYRDNVLISTNDKPVKFAAELLQSEGASRVIQDMRRKLSPTVIIYDMPPMLANDDVKAFLPNVDCAVLAAAAESTTHRELDVCERELSRQTNVVGIVLNKCRYMPDKYGY